MYTKSSKVQSLFILLSCLLLSFTINPWPPNTLKGTWVLHTPNGYTMIEIRDTNDITYTSFVDRQRQTGKKYADRYWYYKSKARMGYWNDKMIWILTDDFRFDFKISGDSLIEVDKMGVQGIYLKMETDKQKAYKKFNNSDIKDRLDWVSPNEHFTSGKNYYQFKSIPCTASENKKFGEVAEAGDSIFKPALKDTLILIKKTDQKTYKFPFEKFE